MPASATPPDHNAPSQFGGWLLLVFGLWTAWRGWGEIKRAKFYTPRSRLDGSIVPGRVVGEETLHDSLRRTLSPDAIPRFKKVTAHSVEDRVKMIRNFIREGAEDPKVRAAALGVVTRVCGDKWCVGAKDYAAESEAIFNAVVDPRSPLAVRYTLDHPTLDTYTSVQKLAHLKGGDCASITVALGSYLGSIGRPVELVIMQSKGTDSWSHILLREPTDGFDGVSAPASGPRRYRYYDGSMQQGNKWMPAGWAPPGLEETLVTGRPSGITVKAKAIPVFDT